MSGLSAGIGASAAAPLLNVPTMQYRAQDVRNRLEKLRIIVNQHQPDCGNRTRRCAHGPSTTSTRKCQATGTYEVLTTGKNSGRSPLKC